MFWFTLVGVMLLMVWVLWVLYIVNPYGQVAISLLLRVEQAEPWIDPFLRTVCCLFGQASHLVLLEVWVLAADEGQMEQRIVQRLQQAQPTLRFYGNVVDIGTFIPQAQGQVLWVFDMIEHNTPVTVLQALEQLLMQSGPRSPGSIVPKSSPV